MVLSNFGSSAKGRMACGNRVEYMMGDVGMGDRREGGEGNGLIVYVHTYDTHNNERHRRGQSLILGQLRIQGGIGDNV